MMRRSAPLVLVFVMLLTACNGGTPTGDTAEDEPEDLLLLMVHAQRYFEKLHLSGEAENWELADIYAHELEEIGEAMRDGGYEAHGTPLESLARGSFLPSIEQLEDAIDARDPAAFAARMETVAASCNSCHAASGYAAVRIIVPTDPGHPYASQDFAP
jgi:hypothetical protein